MSSYETKTIRRFGFKTFTLSIQSELQIFESEFVELQNRGKNQHMTHTRLKVTNAKNEKGKKLVVIWQRKEIMESEDSEDYIIISSDEDEPINKKAKNEEIFKNGGSVSLSYHFG